MQITDPDPFVYNIEHRYGKHQKFACHVDNHNQRIDKGVPDFLCLIDFIQLLPRFLVFADEVGTDMMQFEFKLHVVVKEHIPVIVFLSPIPELVFVHLQSALGALFVVEHKRNQKYERDKTQPPPVGADDHQCCRHIDECGDDVKHKPGHVKHGRELIPDLSDPVTHVR
ncbi:unknown [Clostridium sp. CAG:448]|nr:unknown [Clostridium sp. CAG:448]